MAGRKKSDRVTIRNVAEDAGVSVAAVSKVLRNAYGVSEGLRARVQVSMQKLGYRPHAAARGMRGQTYTLGVLLPDLRNSFFADIMAGINEALVRTQYQPLLGVGQKGSTTETAMVDAMIDRQMDGLLLIAPHLPNEDLVRIATGIPTVIIGLHQPDAAAFDTVNNNDELGGRLAVRHLHEAGYRNIAYLSLQASPHAERDTYFHRDVGYRAAMEELGLQKYTRVFSAPDTARDIQVAARHLLQSREKPEALFCWSDFVAFEVLSVANDLGLSVPRDIALVGYDNTSYCDLSQNAMTSIDQSGQVLGLQAARLLIERIQGRTTAEHFVVTPRLVARASSRPGKA